MTIDIPNSACLRWVEVDSDGISALTGTLPVYTNRLNYHWTSVPRSLVFDYGQKYIIGDSVKVQFTTDASSIDIRLYNYRTDVEVSDLSGDESAVYTYNNGNVIYNLTIDTSLLSGQYYVVITLSDGVDTQYFRCERFDVSDYSTDETVKIEWGTSDRLGVYNPSGDTYFFRLDARFFKLSFGEDKATYEDSDYDFSVQDSAPILSIELEIGAVPFFIAEKILLALQHETFKINGVEFQTGEDFSPEITGEGVDTTNFVNGSILLRKKEYEVHTSITDDEPADTNYLLEGISGNYISEEGTNIILWTT